MMQCLSGINSIKQGNKGTTLLYWNRIMEDRCTFTTSNSIIILTDFILYERIQIYVCFYYIWNGTVVKQNILQIKSTSHIEIQNIGWILVNKFDLVPCLDRIIENTQPIWKHENDFTRKRIYTSDFRHPNMTKISTINCQIQTFLCYQ